MSNLAVLESGLVNIYDYQEQKERIVNARELHEFLGIGKDFTSWMKNKLTKYGFVEGEDYYLTLTKIGERKNVTKHDYYLKIDTAKEVAMVENNEQGRQVRKYFIQVEKKFREQNNQPPMTIEDLIIAQAQSLKDIRLKQEMLETQQRQQENKVIKLETEFNKESVIEGYKSNDNLARKFNLLSTNNKPHFGFIDAIAKHLRIYKAKAGYEDEYIKAVRETLQGGTVGIAVYYSEKATCLIEVFLQNNFHPIPKFYVRKPKVGMFNYAEFKLGDKTYKFNKNTYMKYSK